VVTTVDIPKDVLFTLVGEIPLGITLAPARTTADGSSTIAVRTTADTPVGEHQLTLEVLGKRKSFVLEIEKRSQDNPLFYTVRIHNLPDGAVFGQTHSAERELGSSVNLIAGKRDGFVFERWSADIEFLARDNGGINFTMPNHAVEITAHWKPLLLNDGSKYPQASQAQDMGAASLVNGKQANASSSRQTEVSYHHEAVTQQLQAGMQIATLSLSTNAMANFKAPTLAALNKSGAELRLVTPSVSARFPTEFMCALLALEGNDYSIAVEPSAGTGDTLMSVVVRVLVDGVSIGSTGSTFWITINLVDATKHVAAGTAVLGDCISAVHEGRNIGGKYDSAKVAFEFEATALERPYSVKYVPNLIKTTLKLGTTAIVDKTGNSTSAEMDVAPMIEADRALVPIRFVAENILGLPILGWERETETVTLSDEIRTLSFVIGELADSMDVPARIVGERTMVPIRFVSEFFGATVSFDSHTGEIEIIR
jgi:uncharacterized repeat protein (TIGR02543 family)